MHRAVIRAGIVALSISFTAFSQSEMPLRDRAQKYLVDLIRLDTSLKSPIRKRVEKVGKVASKSFAEKAILLETNTQLRQSQKERGRRKGDRTILSKARILTGTEAQALAEIAAAKKQRKSQKSQESASRSCITLGEILE